MQGKRQALTLTTLLKLPRDFRPPHFTLLLTDRRISRWIILLVRLFSWLVSLPSSRLRYILLEICRVFLVRSNMVFEVCDTYHLLYFFLVLTITISTTIQGECQILLYFQLYRNVLTYNWTWVIFSPYSRGHHRTKQRSSCECRAQPRGIHRIGTTQWSEYPREWYSSFQKRQATIVTGSQFFTTMAVTENTLWNRSWCRIRWVDFE